MPSGGARAHGGRAPDPDALRRDRDSGDWTVLPVQGREGPAPEWPLADRLEREGVLWEREWRRPQAVMWERNGQEAEVAMYVRSLAIAERLDASVASRTLIRQQQEALGISVPGLARNRWRIDQVATPRVPARSVSGRSVRERFKVVPGGNGAA